MAYNSMQGTRTRTEVVNAFMRGVYGWMFLGLALTAGVAWATLNVPALSQFLFQVNEQGQIIGVSPVIWLLFIAELGIVFTLSFRVQKMNPTTSTALFLVYSGLNGLTLTPILLAYTMASVFSAFLVCSGMFGAMSLYGLLTKKDLTSWGSFLFMGLIGILIAMVVNIFLQSSAMSLVISGLGVIIFTGLTAYDTQKLKDMGDVMGNDAAAVRRGTIMGALTLYLDFINLFIMLLRLMGVARD